MNMVSAHMGGIPVTLWCLRAIMYYITSSLDHAKAENCPRRQMSFVFISVERRISHLLILAPGLFESQVSQWHRTKRSRTKSNWEQQKHDVSIVRWLQTLWKRSRFWLRFWSAKVAGFYGSNTIWGFYDG